MSRAAANVAWSIAVLAFLPGCVERRFRIESNPPGAYVFVNNVPQGQTPVDVPFIYYGDYDIELKKDGYQTKKVKQPIETPWYQYPPIDFLSESVYPFQITDVRPLLYDLELLPQPNLEQLKAEASDLRRQGKALPAPRFPPEDKKAKADDLPLPRPAEIRPGRPEPEMPVTPPRPVKPAFDMKP